MAQTSTSVENRAQRRRMEREQLRPPAAVAEMTAALEVLCEPGGWHELRVLAGRNGKEITNGYFNSPELLAKAAATLNQRGRNVYFTLNPALAQLSARAENHVVERAERATKDYEIASRRWLLIDIDPKRASGISSTDAQHEAALDRANQIRQYLMEEWNWAAPILMSSGNGAYLLFRIALDNNDAAKQLLERVLKALAQRFNDDEVEIDVTTFNASRIARIPGSVNRKGDSTETRPHRRAALVDIPPELELVSREQLEPVAGEVAPTDPPAEGSSSASPELHTVLLALEQRGITAKEPQPYKDGLKYTLSACLFNPDHVGTSVAIIEYASGAKQYSCLHDQCKGRKWGDVLRELKLNRPRSASAGPTARTPRMKDAPVAPVLKLAALYGLAGEVVNVILPCSEANDATLLLHLLVGYGNGIGRSAYYRVENTNHYCNLFYVAVGDTSRGRKGTAWGQIRPLLAMAADPLWAQSRIQGGLSSGEGLIAAVADRNEEKTDKRLLIVQTEFASVLRVMNREGNTLSAVIRQAWDDGALHVLTKRDPLHVQDAHIAIVGHITKEELQRSLSETESANGFGNRFLWARSQRSKFLPEGAEISDEAIHDLVERLKSAVHAGKATGQMHRDDEAREWWAAGYKRLSEGVPGLLGTLTSRAEAQVLRLSMIYALLDCSSIIRVEHLQAAQAVWQYCFESAKFIFGSALGYPLADTIWEALRVAGASGLSRTQISSEVLGRNHQAAQITNALVFLEEHALAYRRDVGEGRSTTEVWYAGPRIETGPDTAH